MARLRYNGLSTTLGAALDGTATAVTFGAALTHSGGTAVPTITGSDYIPLAIMTSTGYVSEVVYLTAYTSGATTGTITRGQEGSAGVAHASGDRVIHGPTVGDIPSGDSTAPANPVEGQLWYDRSATPSTYSLTVQDENANISTAVTQIDFQGAGVTTTAGTGEVIVTIPGATSSGYRGSRVYATATQTIGAAWTAVTFGSESFDSDAFHSTATNTTRLTIPSGMAGKYLINATVSYAANATGARFVSVMKNGLTRSDINAANSVGSGFRTRVATTAVMSLAVGDYVEVHAYQNAGTNLEVGDTTPAGDVGETWASITYLGA